MNGFALAAAQYDSREPEYSTDYCCQWCNVRITFERWDDDRVCQGCAWSWCPECGAFCEECEHGTVPMGEWAIGPRAKGCAS